mmetsp:Transcript_12192/g.22598  ORF Transcript_12192/g.22598 Transcript_12192/m.22598 type:complete len:240 (+) Transcript_12192:55-774(+)
MEGCVGAAVAAKEGLASLPYEDKWSMVRLTLVFEVALGAALLVGSLFVRVEYGAGASFQAVFTAFVHVVYALALLSMVKQRDVRYCQFVAGAMVMMNVLLLETAALWNGLAGGIQVGICVIDGGMAERFVSVIVMIIFLAHAALTLMTFLWKDDLVPSFHTAGSGYEYTGGQSDGASLNMFSAGGANSTFESSGAATSNVESFRGDDDGYQQTLGHSNAQTSAQGKSSKFVIDDDDAEL